MVQVTKIGYAGFNTTHMEAMLAYYTEVIGFTLKERGGDGAACLSNALDHHSIALYPSSESGLRHIGFQIHSGQSLQEVSAQLRDRGIQVDTQTDAQPGISALLQLHDPEGNTVQLYAIMQPARQNFRGSGIVPQKLGHLAMAVHDVQRTAEFYQNILGFRVSDWHEDFPQRPKVWKDSPQAVNHWGLMPSHEFMFME